MLRTKEQNRKLKDRRLLRKLRGMPAKSSSRNIKGKIVGIEYRTEAEIKSGYVMFLLETEDTSANTTDLETLERINVFIRKKDFDSNKRYVFASYLLNDLI